MLAGLFSYPFTGFGKQSFGQWRFDDVCEICKRSFFHFLSGFCGDIFSGLAEQFFAGLFGDAPSWQVSLVALLSFISISCVVYIINDIRDRGEDAIHPVKRLRPLEQKTSPFHDNRAVKQRDGLHWTRPELVGEVLQVIRALADDEEVRLGDHFVEVGREYGTVTGRRRRPGCISPDR